MVEIATVFSVVSYFSHQEAGVSPDAKVGTAKHENMIASNYWSKIRGNLAVILEDSGQLVHNAF